MLHYFSNAIQTYELEAKWLISNAKLFTSSLKFLLYAWS